MDFWDWSFQATSDTEMEVRLQAAVSTFQFLFKESDLILIIPKVQMTVFTMIIQKKFIVSCVLKSLIIL